MKVLPEAARALARLSRRPRAATQGVITLVEEGRFQLEDGEGVRWLFVLAHDAPLEIADLQALQEAEVPVRVECGDRAGPAARVAHDVEPLA